VSQVTQPLDSPAIKKEWRTAEDKEGGQDDLERDLDLELYLGKGKTVELLKPPQDQIPSIY
jgi:hypothetical protein